MWRSLARNTGGKQNAERFDARLHYTPPSSGTSTVTLRVLPFEGEAVVTDNAVDLRLEVSERRLNVLVHEPRPSWNAAFVRRALEQDPSFEVSTIVQASKGLAVRAGSPPAALTAAALSPFDVVLIGAPEELRQSELEALRTFARIRGGAVVFLPDRRPAGRYLELIPSAKLDPSAKFDEVLVDRAIAIQSIAGAPLRASEIAVYRESPPGASVLASTGFRGARGQSYSSGPLAQVASSSQERWMRGAFALRQTTGSGGSGGPGSPRRQPQRRRGSRRPSRQEFLVLVRT